jgi:hypothetical protein
MVSTAFVFFVALSTNSLWDRMNDISRSIDFMAVKERQLLTQVALDAPEKFEPLRASFGAYNERIIDHELYNGPLVGTNEIAGSIRQIEEIVLSVPQTGTETIRYTESLDAFLTSRDAYLGALSDLGVPDIQWFSVTILGMSLVALLTLLPRVRPWGSLGNVSVGVVLAVGTIQLGMWVMNTYSSMSGRWIAPLIYALEPEGAPPGFSGQLFAVGAGCLGLLVILVLGYQGKRRRPKLIPAPSDKTEIDLLIEIRDAMNSSSSDLADGLDASSSGKPPPTDPPE